MSKTSSILVGLIALAVLILAPTIHGTQQNPVLKWHTYAGSAMNDDGAAIAVDSSGNTYLAGWSEAPWGSPIHPHSGGRDAFVAKLNSTGVLVWNTFLGSPDVDEAEAITVDRSGNVYVVGWSRARWDGTGGFSGQWGAFVAKLNSQGQLQWHHFMTPDGNEVGLAVAVDASGNVYVGGWGGMAWDTPPSEQAAGSYVAKLNSSGVEVWHAFFSETGPYGLQALAVDVGGNVYAAGRSEQTWGSPISPYSGGIDAFVAKLNDAGVLKWHTFMGSSGSDLPESIALDGSGNVYVTGTSWATWGTPVKPHAAVGGDAFAAKLDSSGVRQWHTFMGWESMGWAIAVDGSENAYVAGVWAAEPMTHPGGYVASLDRDGVLQWTTFLEAIIDAMALD